MPPSEAHRGAAVLCAGVVHVYASEQGPIAALRDVDLVVEAGEILAIVGPSGSGKTTLMSLLGGLLRPTAGTIRIGGEDITRLDERELGRLRATELSLLLQDPLRNLLPYATAPENVAFAARGARRRGWPLHRGAAEIIDALGLAELSDRPVHQLSSGEQSRAAIASALATSPRVLLADEPTGQLDPDSRETVVAALREAHELTGATVIVVTHDMALAAALPRSLVIANGAVSAEGRGRRRYAVVNQSGAIQLPSDVHARYPAGTLFEVSVQDGSVVLAPADEARGSAAAPRDEA